VENSFLFISITYLMTFVIGKLLERIQVPWIFGAILGGQEMHGPVALCHFIESPPLRLGEGRIGNAG
jgi:Kef-type K+ transport system membrane component KefB